MEQQVRIEQVKDGSGTNLSVLLANTGNSVAVYANGTIVLTDSNVNFNNTATVNVSAIANGTMQTNISFSVNSSAVGGTVNARQILYFAGA